MSEEKHFMGELGSEFILEWGLGCYGEENFEGYGMCLRLWFSQSFKREGTDVYLWLIHVNVWQKPTPYCKAIILQLKINKFLKIDQKSNAQSLWRVYKARIVYIRK